MTRVRNEGENDHEGEPWKLGSDGIGSRSASVMGSAYPEPGSTLGPATTFGYRAARYAKGEK